MSASLQGMISKWATEAPNKIAISDGITIISYSELDRLIGLLSSILSNGNAISRRIAILAKCRPLTLTVLLSIWRSRCMCVPLDPSMPADRLAYVLQDIDPEIVIADYNGSELIKKSSSYRGEIIDLRSLEMLLNSPNEAPLTEKNELDKRIDKNGAAYCIYTSGSTGRPKGVVIEHGSIMAFIAGALEVYDVDSESRCASFSPLHFDAFLFDMIVPLYAGATLYLYTDIVSPDPILDFLKQNSISHFSAWGAMLPLITQSDLFGATKLENLKTILTGADTPNLNAVRIWLETHGVHRIINGYGPTEAACAVSAHVIHHTEPRRVAPYPIGRPFKYAILKLVDDAGYTIEEPNRCGELLIGGPQVMRGYWKVPEKSNASLITEGKVRFYKTGDLCRYLDDGSIQFIGRKDDEANLGGYRVHLSEIKRVAMLHSGVLEAEAVLLKTLDMEKIIVVALVAMNGDSCDRNTLRDEVRSRMVSELPSYMIPRLITVVENFPRLSSGKCDRKALEELIGNNSYSKNMERYRK